MRHALTLICVLAAMPAAADPAADAAAARRVEDALGGLTSLRAEFRQSVTDAQGRLIEQAEGTMALARPGRFRWDYRVPQQVIVSDGRTVWFHDVELEQVTIRAAAETLEGTPAMLLAGKGVLAAEFAITDAGDQDGLAWSLLTPRRPDGDFRELRLGFAGGDLRRMLLLDRLGQVTRLEFEDVEHNPRLDGSLFTFVPPAGVDVVGRAPSG
ncbi:MAG TPA: outer membrane lipoprotein chaperone LolA [Steroidobacteraceae bacterium]|nr:outer membrane lipoprotein chaperone LolA [Steroidobacteraceae bacterium]